MFSRLKQDACNIKYENLTTSCNFVNIGISTSHKIAEKY